MSARWFWPAILLPPLPVGRVPPQRLLGSSGVVERNFRIFNVSLCFSLSSFVFIIIRLNSSDVTFWFTVTLHSIIGFVICIHLFMQPLKCFLSPYFWMPSLTPWNIDILSPKNGGSVFKIGSIRWFIRFQPVIFQGGYRGSQPTKGRKQFLPGDPVVTVGRHGRHVFENVS